MVDSCQFSPCSDLELQESFLKLSGYPGAVLDIQQKKPLLKMPRYDCGVLQHIADTCGELALYRLINRSLIPTALEHGTDKALVGVLDLRRLIPSLDISKDMFGVEKHALDTGRAIADSLCANPHQIFLDQTNRFAYKSKRYGLPVSRLGLLIYSAGALEEMPGTDGYLFRDSTNKTASLAGGIVFKHPLSELEQAIRRAVSIADKIALIRTKIEQRFDGISYDPDDALILGLELTELLYSERLNNEASSCDAMAEDGYSRQLLEVVEFLNQKISFLEELQVQLRLLFLNMDFLLRPDQWDNPDPERTRNSLRAAYDKLSGWLGTNAITTAQDISIRKHLCTVREKLPPDLDLLETV